jgi:hypothetical protein
MHADLFAFRRFPHVTSSGLVYVLAAFVLPEFRKNLTIGLACDLLSAIFAFCRASARD